MLDIWLVGGLTAVAAAAGFVDAIAGGGGLIMMPALLFAGLPPHVALGTNKVQSSCGTAVACWRYWRAGLFSLRAARWLVCVVFAGALLGAGAIQFVSARALGLVVPVLLMAVAVYTVLSPRMSDHEGRARIGAGAYLPLAGGIGFYDGFFGPGTGSFFAVSLVGLRGLGLTRATGLAKLLNLTSNWASVLVFAGAGKVLWGPAGCMALGNMAGGWLGAHCATRLGARVIRPLLVVASLALTVKLVAGWFGT